MKCRELASQSVWWPGLSKQLKEMVHQSPETEATTTHSDNTPSLALAEGCERSVCVEAGHLPARGGL